jgi:signal transduction histidine kinase/ActR/RegA family two-component response regulator
MPTREDAQLLLEASGECVFLTDREGRILALNPMAQQMVGRTRQVLGLSFHDLMGCLLPADHAPALCPVEHVVQTGEVMMLVSHLWKRGDLHYELSSSFWPRLQRGRRIGAVIVCRDLTSAIEAQRDVQRVAHLAEDAPNPIVEFEADGTMRYANAAMVELITQCGALHTGVEAVLPANLSAILRNCLSARAPSARIEHAVAGRVIAWSFFPLGELEQVRAYGLDITADVALRRAKEAAEESARAKGIFLATMSHELRTPMNGVLGCTQLLQDTSLTESQRQLIQTMERSAQALLGLVNDILDFSKVEAGKLTLETAEVDLRSLIEDVVTLVSELARQKGLALAVKVAPGVPQELRGDPVRLRQLLFNLVGNAIKFTETGGVEVSVEQPESTGDMAGRMLLRWSVTDTGIGMTEEQQARLFQAYSQADASTARRFGGTGLGLMICRQLVELMDGEITVQSRIGQGTTFCYTTVLSLPLERTVGGPADSGIRRNAVPRVLVADDNEINQVVASKFLQKLGYQVEVVPNGREAVEMLACASYDAVLLDCDMPEMDGYEAARLIRQREQERGTRVPIIALTGHVSQDAIDRCRQAGMDDVMTKPVTLTVLRTMLDRFLEGPTP